MGSRDLEEEFFAAPAPGPAPRRRLRLPLVAYAAMGGLALLGLELWAPWRPADRAAGHHPSARLSRTAPGADRSVRHRGAVVALAAGEKADPRRTLVELTIAEPLARVALVDDWDTTAWSADWPPAGSTLRLDVDPGLWRYVQSREQLAGRNGPLLEERQQLDLRAGQVWELRTTPASAADGGASFTWPDLP